MATGLQSTAFDWQNNFTAHLTADITNAALDVFLDTIPTPTEGILVIEPDVPANLEVIFYTSKTASKVTCHASGRGYDGSTAIAHLSGSKVIMAPVGDMFRYIRTVATTTPQGWQPLVPAVSSVTNNGNRSYDITFASDVSAYLSSGMRLRTTRTVAAPTQCTSLNGTTQYYSKASPAGMTFTNNFVVSAWVKLASYGIDNNIASRYNGTSGWRMTVITSGQLALFAYNGGGGNNFQLVSYQSVPLNKWIHVTAQMDMTNTTNDGSNNYVMLDGVNVPVSIARTGTNPTALVQAGNLEIGSYNGGAGPFPGKIAQVAIYSAKVTQANIRATISQGIAGTETSLISAYSFNNSINDLNANANNLTANGSAVATNADSPFGNGAISSTLDYSLVQSISTTVATVQVPEGCTIPTSGGVTSVAYSVQGNPYGWVSDSGRWELLTIGKVLGTTATPAAGTWYNTGSLQLSIPVGTWIYGYTGKFDVERAAAGSINIFATLSTTSSSETNTLMTAAGSNNNQTAWCNNQTISNSLSLSVATIHYLNISTAIASMTNIYMTASQAATKITALPSGL